MPLYEYVCRECGLHFDVLRAMKDADEPLECSYCYSNQTSRCLSSFFAVSEGKSLGSSPNSCSGCSAGSCDSYGRN